MDNKEVVTRLEIVKLATSIGDHDTIVIQNSFLKQANSSKLNEIVSLLGGKNYRQALYLIKSYLNEIDAEVSIDDNEERVLDVEDMLKMSPLARESVKDYRRSAYTEDDLEAFAKNIEKPIEPEKEDNDKINDIPFIESIEEDSKKEKLDKFKKEQSKKEISEAEQKNIDKALESADKETPLDEISKVGNSNAQKKRRGVLSKYKNIREKFAKKTEKDSNDKEVLKTSSVAQNILSKVKQTATSETKKSDAEVSKIESAQKKIKDYKAPEVNIEDNKLDTIYKNREEASQNEDKSLSKSNAESAVSDGRNDVEAAISDAKNVKQEEIAKEAVKEKITNNKETTLKQEVAKKEEKIAEEKAALKKDTEDKKDNRVSSKVEPKADKKTAKTKEEKLDESIIYAPIPHIEHKFRQSFILYPPVKESEIWVEEAVKFLKNVSKNSFTEADVKYFLKEYDFYMGKKDVARASQILLLASNTESKFAQFLLARELFSGKVLVRDFKKSFVIMKKLANEFYPEAVCDLGQFYEYGIGVAKDRKIAIKLYEKAFELGVARATKHINRLKESNGILSTIFKLK